MTMLIDPASCTEVVSAGGVMGESDEGTARGNFITVPASNMLSEEVVGTEVSDNANQDIGTINNVTHFGTSIEACVGSFPGVGDRGVTVRPSVIDAKYDACSKNWHAIMNTAANQLDAASAFRYLS